MLKIAVTKGTIRTSTWDTLYNHLQTGTYALSTNNIFSAWNSTLASDKGYPLVIIESPIVSFKKENINGEYTNSEIVFNLEVYHNSAQNVKALVDAITNSLLTGKVIFEAQRMMNINIEGGSNNAWEEGKKKIHVIDFSVTFRYISN